MDTADDPVSMEEDNEEILNEIPDPTKVSINLCSECGYLQYSLNEDDDDETEIEDEDDVETEIEDENESEIEIGDENENEIEDEDEDDYETEVEDEIEDEDDEI